MLNYNDLKKCLLKKRLLKKVFHKFRSISGVEEPPKQTRYRMVFHGHGNKYPRIVVAGRFSSVRGSSSGRRRGNLARSRSDGISLAYRVAVTRLSSSRGSLSRE